MSRSRNSPSRLLPAAIVLLVITTLAPTPLTAWLTAFRGPLMAFIAPISHPGTWLSQRLRPERELETPIDKATKDQLRAQLRELAHLHARGVQRNAALREQIRQLQSGVPFENPTRFRKVLASRTAYDPGAGLIELRPGALKGVRISSVVVDGATMQLVGLVTTVGPTTCAARPITDRRSGSKPIECIILPDEPVTTRSLAEAVRCTLEPTGGGALSGDVPVDPYNELRIGEDMIVRLDDPYWPDAAQMLVLGRITRIERTDNPRFVRVTVTPLREPTRLRDVVIRIPEEQPEQTGREEDPS